MMWLGWLREHPDGAFRLVAEAPTRKACNQVLAELARKASLPISGHTIVTSAPSPRRRRRK